MGDIDGGKMRSTHVHSPHNLASCLWFPHAAALTNASIGYDPDLFCKFNKKRGGVRKHETKKLGTHCSVTLDCIWSCWQTARWEYGEYECKAMTRWQWSFCSGSWSSISKGKIKTGNPWGVSSSVALLGPITTVARHKGLPGYIVLSIQSFRASGAALTLRDAVKWLNGYSSRCKFSLI